MHDTDLFQLTGMVTWSEGGVAPGVFVMAVDRDQLSAQYRTLTDVSGNYALDVPAGCFDLLFEEIGGQRFTYIRSGVLVAKATTIDARLSPTQNGRGVIGSVDGLSGEPSQWRVVAEALAAGRAGGAITSQAQLDQQGRFDLGILAPGYYLAKLVHVPSGRSQDVLLPVGENAVMLTFDVGTAVAPSTHATDLFSLSGGRASPSPSGGLFNQSRPFQGASEVNFAGSILTVTGGDEPPMFMRAQIPINGPITTYCIYAHDATRSILYKYAVTVNTIFSYSGPCSAVPAGVWQFEDGEGDIYTLLAYTPFPHTVQYNSNAPDIVQAVWRA
jgi:hypothetical protein